MKVPSLLIACGFAVGLFTSKPQVIAQSAYYHTPSKLKALECLDGRGLANCEQYFTGFAHTFNLVITTDVQKDSGDGLCGDISDLVFEFRHLVNTNSELAQNDAQKVLIGLLIQNYNCATHRNAPPIRNTVSAGHLLDMCKGGDVDFESCSEYVAGFLDSLLATEEMSEQKFFCGERRLLNPVSVTAMLNQALLADFRRRKDSAVQVMREELQRHLPCKN